MKKTHLLALVASLLTCNTYAARPHFYLEMENRGEVDATISFRKDIGPIHLEPALADETVLRAHEVSPRYGVVMDDNDPAYTFDIFFARKDQCRVSVGFSAPRKPKITIQGVGCNGAGYIFSDRGTVRLFITDIQ